MWILQEKLLRTDIFYSLSDYMLHSANRLSVVPAVEIYKATATKS